MGIIKVSGITCYAYHGCMEEEAIMGGSYRVDIEINADFEEAAASDDLSKTVDYVKVYDIVNDQMKIRSKLIEHVAKRIGDELIKKIPRILKTEVEVTKLHPPIKGDVQEVSVLYIAKRISG